MYIQGRYVASLVHRIVLKREVPRPNLGGRTKWGTLVPACGTIVPRFGSRAGPLRLNPTGSPSNDALPPGGASVAVENMIDDVGRKPSAS